MLMLWVQRTLRTDTSPNDGLGPISMIGHHLNFVQMVHQLVDGTEEKVPSREKAYRNKSGQGHTRCHPHLHFFEDRKFDEAIRRHILQRIGHSRPGYR